MYINSGMLNPDQLLLLNAAIMSGLEAAVESFTDIRAPRISLMRTDLGVGSADALTKRIPASIAFPFSPPTARAEDLSTEDRPFHPLVRNNVLIAVKPWGVGYWVSRKDFFNDLHGTLGNIPKRLARAALKIPDISLAQLLRNGKTILDYTGTAAFATAKPNSVNGATSGNYGNLYTGMPLTVANLGRVIADMMGRVGEDGMNLGIKPDTLIIPANLYPEAVTATMNRSVVFSHTAGVGNPAPGQASLTAAQGDNWISFAGVIKQIVVLDELTDGGQTIDKTTWYVAECMNPDHYGAAGLLCAAEAGFELLTNLSPSDPDVYYKNRLSWAIERYVGTGFGLTYLLSRVES